MTEVPLVPKTSQNTLDYLNQTKIPYKYDKWPKWPRKTKNLQNTLDTQKKPDTPPKHKKWPKYPKNIEMTEIPPKS